MANFPTSAPSFAGFTSSHTLSADNHAAQHNLEQAEVVAVAAKIGTGSSTPILGTVLRGTGTGTSSWADVDLTTDVTGVLPTANGGTGTNSTTGTGSVVFSSNANLNSPTLNSPSLTSPAITAGGTWTGSPSITTPTLTTPTIASFVNSIHNHQNNAGGGQLAYGSLLSTIFSGQIVTGVNGGTAGGDTNFINLGGLKICWGTTAVMTLSAASQATYTITFPTTYTSTPWASLSGQSQGTTTLTQAQLNVAPTTTGMVPEILGTTGAATGTITGAWIVIGT